MVLVELFGAPGAGKSTLTTAAAERARVVTRHQMSEAWNRLPKRRRAAFLARSALDHRSVVHAMSLVIRGRLTNGDSIFRLGRLIAKRDWLASQTGVVLLDQGGLQELWSALYSSDVDRPDHRLLTNLIMSLYRGIDTRIIVVAVDPHTAAARIGGRPDGNSRFDRLPAAELLDSQSRTVDLQRRIVDAATAAGLAMTTLDGSVPAATLVDRLVDCLDAADSGD